MDIQNQTDKLESKIDVLLQQGATHTSELASMKAHLKKQNGKVFKNVDAISDILFRMHDMKLQIDNMRSAQDQKKNDGSRLRWIIVASVVGIASSILTTAINYYVFSS